MRHLSTTLLFHDRFAQSPLMKNRMRMLPQTSTRCLMLAPAYYSSPSVTGPTKGHPYGLALLECANLRIPSCISPLLPPLCYRVGPLWSTCWATNTLHLNILGLFALATHTLVGLRWVICTLGLVLAIFLFSFALFYDCTSGPLRPAHIS